ncbi:MAG: hypothetical protein ACRDD8_04925 [Bacteroidales bacterium]
MAFTQPCFIRRNTEELINYLKDIGHKEIKSISKNKGDEKYLYTCYGKFSQENGHFIKCLKDCNCGTNEELFKSIAALRDDTDDKQLFTDGNGYWQTCVGRFRFKNEPFFKLHKATVEELIEYFK